MRVKFWQPAGTTDVPGKGEFTERFAPYAFDRMVGLTVPWTYRHDEEGSEVLRLGRATVIAVTVLDDGSGAEWEVELIEEDNDGKPGT